MGHPSPGSQSNDTEQSLDPSRESRREKGQQKTREKSKGWYDQAQGIKSEGEWTRPTDIAKMIAKREKNVTAKNIKRRLDEHYPGWGQKDVAKKSG